MLYIFPHPDDKSFGPAGVIHQQVVAGHQVPLLTLRKGGAPQIRHTLGLTVEQMGEIRYQEMLLVKNVLGIAKMIVLDYPDSGLKKTGDKVHFEIAFEKHQPVLADITLNFRNNCIIFQIPRL
jgi:LmbE family N-acetylglucosaminyl deacetylase